ncbi:hypothetical protein G6011_11067 [Alternaria panax]|uniref:Large ribosomal subunit protein mL49 n=1 Tax=Alternaria panax TaxID=48097 RepID=A0AAD4ICV2_9PLEO|nr:hypothetical protein G6011_11067 [Alternaria panax]
MPRLPSLLPLRRPLAAPRAGACRPHLRFSTATPWQAEQPRADSKHMAQPSLPPQEARRAADVAAAESLTEADSAQPRAQKPALPSKPARADRKPASTASQPEPTAAHDGAPTLKNKAAKTPKLSLPPPTYAVSRSASKNLPIYTDYKRGGNLHLTTVRKITGDISALRDELTVFLNKKNDDVKINSLTQHVVVKGHHTGEIAQFLKARGM